MRREGTSVAEFCRAAEPPQSSLRAPGETTHNTDCAAEKRCENRLVCASFLLPFVSYTRAVETNGSDNGHAKFM